MKLQRHLPARIGIKKDYRSNPKPLFLDLDNNVKHRELETDLYDIRDAFHSSILRIPYRDSSMLTRIIYAVVGSEI